MASSLVNQLANGLQGLNFASAAQGFVLPVISPQQPVFLLFLVTPNPAVASVAPVVPAQPDSSASAPPMVRPDPVPRPVCTVCKKETGRPFRGQRKNGGRLKCRACYTYFVAYKKERPKRLWNNKIQKRQRRTQPHQRPARRQSRRSRSPSPDMEADDSVHDELELALQALYDINNYVQHSLVSSSDGERGMVHYGQDMNLQAPEVLFDSSEPFHGGVFVHPEDELNEMAWQLRQ